jgi:hypothetical protein
MANFSEAFKHLDEGIAITNGNPKDDGYLLMYTMVDKSIGSRLIIQVYPGRVNPIVYQPTQADILSTSWRIVKDIEL